MKDLRSLLAGLIGGALVCLCVWGIVSIVDEPVTTDTADFNIEDHVDLDELNGADGEDGKNGARGYTGAKGDKGDTGDKGDQGVAGTTPVIDLDELADLVEELIEEGDAEPVWQRTGDEGNYHYAFSADDSGYHNFTLKHFGAGDFVVTLEFEDGATVTLIDTEGHVNADYSGVLLDDDEVNELHISADGDWKITVEE